MTLKGLSTALALISTCGALIWTLSYSRATAIPQVINKVRSYAVMNLTWARAENWRKDLGEAPCQWRAKQTIPFFGSFSVDCLVDGRSWMRFEVSSDKHTVVPADASTTKRVEELAEWARLRKRYP